MRHPRRRQRNAVSALAPATTPTQTHRHDDWRYAKGQFRWVVPPAATAPVRRVAVLYAHLAMGADRHSRVVRWQGHSVAQLGFVNNTVLALTTASIGFAVSRELSGWQSCLLVIGIVCLVSSAGLALWCAVNRLEDFRESAQLARRRMGIVELRERRRKNRKRSKRTWTLLYWQLWTFAVGALLAVGALVFRAS